MELSSLNSLQIEKRLFGETHRGGPENMEAGIGVKTARTRINLNALGKKVSILHANNLCIQLFSNQPTNQTNKHTNKD
jgi:hypothetical protein